MNQNTPYYLIGGEKVVYQLANRFYDIMESDPHAADLLAIHPKPLNSVRVRFFEFLSGWLGGPDLFVQKYGHPRLRARHLPFSVTIHQRDLWMLCMNQALDDVIKNEQIRRELQKSFYQLATHMINSN
ncbi:group II truncated hemoglobin [Catenovulum adriaticum]|uniref:Group II truncated hemoglobin n=1 Tax=Catenovulum adriaticum TaxID=2984846 RepID=A0ABY7AL88_9ALTE|nr:group II truncated hemoglobin [Catenovulum sp. TS8]WAJ70304.1 group II truncated hemoglobin [Catenovulum sp. TS8]